MTLPQLKRSGLGLLPPTLRLGLVFTLSVVYVLVNDLAIAAGVMLAGILIFHASCRRSWKVGLAAIFPGLMLLAYNAILSPQESGGIHWLFLTINRAGIERGLVTGMRLIGVMLVSFAWLITTPIPEMYQGLAWIKQGRPWVLELLRGVQIVKREFVALTQSLIIRGLKWDSPLANLRNLTPLAMAIIPRIADNAQKTTFAMQSHSASRQALAVDESGIEVQGASVRYSPRLPDVLHDIHLAVRPADFVYLAGPDLAGKTTLLRLMGGVIPRIIGEFRGKVRVAGLVTHEVQLSELCSVARYVAPEPFSSIYGLTVGQEILHLAADEEAAHEHLRLMGVDHLWERETTKLSGGQQVRLVLAGALASGARYLLLDSPMQELDPEGRLDFMHALETLHARREVTVVVADPFWQELVRFTKRVAVLEDGRLAADVPPADFFTDAWTERCRLTGRLARPNLAAPGKRIAGMEGVHVSLEDHPVLHGIDLDVHEGELLAIMGPNGSGKTTAMLTMAGAIRPQKGNVSAPGRMGYVFQDAKIQMVADTVLNELGLGPNILKWPRPLAAAFVESGLAWTGLRPDACPLDLHPSQARMLAIAACDTGAAVVILDEPTVGLDSAGIAKVMSWVTDRLARGTAVIVVTHDEEVATLAHRVVVVRDGLVAGERVPGVA